MPPDMPLPDKPPAASGRALVPSGPGARNRRFVLRHRVFSSFGPSFFRMSEVERSPVLVIPMDDQEAVLPLHGLLREFRIASTDDDGVMLGMVGPSLEFVTGLRVGDWLPPEILTGEASWTVDDVFQERALARLNLFLLAWMSGGASSVAREVLSSVGRAPMSAASIEAGLRLMASKVGGITRDDALSRIRGAASEFAYIESLRDGLLRGVVRMLMVLDRMVHTFRGDTTHRELLAQVRRLASLGVADLQSRFDLADAAVSDIEEVVVDLDKVVAALRLHRDGLYVRSRAWEPYIAEWGTMEVRHTAKTWQLVNETYRFLASRFMTVVEWRSAPDPSASADRPGMDW